MMRNIVWFNLFQDKWIDQVRLKTLIIVMWLLSKMENIHFESQIFMRPFLQLIRAFAVARNGLPRMIGIFDSI